MKAYQEPLIVYHVYRRHDIGFSQHGTYATQAEADAVVAQFMAQGIHAGVKSQNVYGKAQCTYYAEMFDNDARKAQETKR